MTNALDQLIGTTTYDPAGHKIGKIKELYLDEKTSQPTWAAVHTGLFGMSSSLVPLMGARTTNDGVTVAVSSDAVKDAPHLDTDNEITPAQEAQLAQYYHLPQPGQTTPGAAGPAPGRTETGAAGRDPRQAAPPQTGRPAQDSSAGMIRSEERLDVGTQRRPTGTAHLRKYVVTEQQTVNVPVTHEEVRIEREPITGQAGGREPDLGAAEQEVTLTADEVVVSKHAVPVERVRLGVEEVTENQTVTEEVRKEKIEADDGGRHEKKPGTGRANR